MKVKYLKTSEIGNIKTSWMIDDEPTIKIKLPSELRNELKLYIEDCKLEDEELIFQSTRTHQCLSRQQAYRIINRAAEQLGMKHIGLTTLRKDVCLSCLSSRHFNLNYSEIFGTSNNSRNYKIYWDSR